MHPLGTTMDGIEGVHENYRLEGLRAAQKKSWEALRAIAARVQPGLTEKQAIDMAYAVLLEMGSPRSWHRPIVRFGENTRLTYMAKQQPDRVLRPNEMFLVDIGPNWLLPEFPGVEYEGDVGQTFVVGNERPAQGACIEAARSLFEEGCEIWRHEQLNGTALYNRLAESARKAGYQLLLEADGHRIGDFPHLKYFNKGLTETEAVPSANLWVLEIHVVEAEGKWGAFFEDVLN